MKKSMKIKDRITFNNKIGFAVCVVFLSVLLGTSLSWARTIIVPDDEATIGAAITAATAGDTIMVRAGAYTTGSIAMKAGVNLIGGAGRETTTITVNGTITGASNTSFEGFKVINGNYSCSAGSNVKIKNNAFVIATTALNYAAVSLTNVNSAEIVNNSVKITSTKAAPSTLKGINISGSNVLIANNNLSLEGKDAVQGLVYTGATHSVKNNIIKTYSQGDPAGGAPVKAEAIYTGGADTLELRYNLLIGKIDETKVGFKVGNIIGMDPCFVVGNDFLTLQDTSPAIDAGDPTYYLYSVRVKNIGIYDSSMPVVTDGGVYTTSTSTLAASWLSSGPVSGISEYQYQITDSSDTVIRGWTSTGTSTSVTASSLTLIYGKTYYFGVKAKNSVGLWSSIGYSDGITVFSPADIDCDGDVDWADFAVFKASWLKRKGEPGYDSRCDFNSDDIVNFIDYATFANEWNPNPPTGLEAKAASYSQIDLSWQDNSDGESGFKIERKIGAEGTYGQIATVGENVTTCSDAGLAAEQTYYYRIRAYGTTFGSTTSSYSNEASVTTPSIVPIANFTASPTEGEIPLVVNFTDKSTGDITSRLWNFGDGGTSTEKNPTHIYNSVRTYTVSLKVTGPGGEDTEEKINYISVTYRGKIYEAYADKKVIIPGEVMNLYAKVTANAFDSYGWLCDNKEFISGVVPAFRLLQETVTINNSINISAYPSYFTPGSHEIKLRASKIINGSSSVNIYSEPFTITVAKDGKIIQDKINNASPGAIVPIEPGVYKLTSDLRVRKNLTLKAIDPNPDKTVIHLGDNYCISIMDDRYFRYPTLAISWPYPHPTQNMYSTQGFVNLNNVTIEGFTIKGLKNGTISAPNTGYGYGSASYYYLKAPVFNFAQNLTIKKCKIIENKGKEGSAVYTWCGTKLTLDNVLIANNEGIRGTWRNYLAYGRLDRPGAAVFVDSEARLVVKNSTIANNFANKPLPDPGNTTVGQAYAAIIVCSRSTVPPETAAVENITYSIMWNNGSGTEDMASNDGTYVYGAILRDSDVQCGPYGPINRLMRSIIERVIREDPLFKNTATYDYYPQNTKCSAMGARF